MQVVATLVQIVLGILIVTDKIGLHTLGWYYIIMGSAILLLYVVVGVITVGRRK